MSLTAFPLAARYAALLEPLNAASPCGNDLEYHPDLLVLQRQTEPAEAAQYGNFTAPGASINWRETENALLKILGEGRDLRALILLLRCRIELAGAQGAAEGLTLIALLIERFPAQLHPQHLIDGEEDLLMRSNALGGLSDPSLLDALRAILVDSGSATRLSVRDVEKSFATPRLGDAQDPESTQRHLQALRDRRDEQLIALAHAHRAALAIAAFGEGDLGIEAPDFTPLLQILQPYALAENLLPQAPAALMPRLKAAFARWLKAGEQLAEPPINDPNPATNIHHARRPGSQDTQPIIEAEVLGETANPGVNPSPAHIAEGSAMPQVLAYPVPTSEAPVPQSGRALSVGQPVQPGNRDDARTLIRAARHWFESFEPSSPVADLLKQAERLVGKPYVDLIDAIPADLLKAWRTQDAD